MSRTELSINDLLNEVLDISEIIDRSKEYISNNTRFGLITREYIPLIPLKYLELEWYLRFRSIVSTIPFVIRITKVTNALVHDKVPMSRGNEWVVPNIISRSKKDGSLILHAAPNENDDLIKESLYVVTTGTPHFATDEELELINAKILPTSKSLKRIALIYRLNQIIRFGGTTEIDKTWSLINS